MSDIRKMIKSGLMYQVKRAVSMLEEFNAPGKHDQRTHNPRVGGSGGGGAYRKPDFRGRSREDIKRHQRQRNTPYVDKAEAAIGKLNESWGEPLPQIGRTLRTVNSLDTERKDKIIDDYDRKAVKKGSQYLDPLGNHDAYRIYQVDLGKELIEDGGLEKIIRDDVPADIRENASGQWSTRLYDLDRIGTVGQELKKKGFRLGVVIDPEGPPSSGKVVSVYPVNEQFQKSLKKSGLFSRDDINLEERNFLRESVIEARGREITRIESVSGQSTGQHRRRRFSVIAAVGDLDSRYELIHLSEFYWGVLDRDENEVVASGSKTFVERWVSEQDG